MTAGLLERDAELRRLRETLRGAGQGRGSVVLVSGEAGIGKTSLVRAFAREAAGRARVLAGACDDLVTPRTLGPFRDMARGAAPALARAMEPGAGRDAVFGAVHQELAGGPAVLLVEDVHWADDATLDVLRYLAWRIPELPVVLVLTYREDELGGQHPLRRVLAALPTARCGGCSCGRCRPGRSPSWPAATAPTPPPCWRPPPATRSSSPGCWPTPGSRCRPPSATPSWPGSRASATRPARRWSCWPSCPAGPSGGWPRSCSASSWRPLTRPSGGACWRPTPGTSGSATSWPAGRSSASCRPPPGSPATARSWPPWPATRASSCRGSPTTPTGPATPRRSWATAWPRPGRRPGPAPTPRLWPTTSWCWPGRPGCRPASGRPCSRRASGSSTTCPGSRRRRPGPSGSSPWRRGPATRAAWARPSPPCRGCATWSTTRPAPRRPPPGPWPCWCRSATRRGWAGPAPTWPPSSS